MNKYLNLLIKFTQSVFSFIKVTMLNIINKLLTPLIQWELERLRSWESRDTTKKKKKLMRELNELLEFKISIAHPKLLSKRFASPFLVQIYVPKARLEVTEKIKTEFSAEKSIEHLSDSTLTLGQIVKIKLVSPEIVFSDAIIKKLDTHINVANFLGKPSDNCHPGLHPVILTITDPKSGIEYQSIKFSLQITDFVFDHVSRPLLSNMMTAILCIGSFVMFVLTLLGQIDTTLGIASGTTAGALSSAIYMRFFTLYQKPNASKYP